MNGGNPQQHSEESGWHYSGAGNTSPTDAPGHGDELSHQSDQSGTVEWSASEFVVHHKGIGWYLLLLLIIVAVSAGLYWLTKQILVLVVIPLLGLLFGITAARKPRVIGYRADRRGLTVGNQFYPYGAFKSFAIVDEGAFSSISFLPMKRLSLSTRIYFDPQDQAAILDVIGQHLPMERGEMSILDELMFRIRF